MYHILRREAETTLHPNLPAFAAGHYQPRDNDERLDFFGYCQANNLYAHAARLYADAFTVDPALAQDLRAGYRFRAACSAAAAGCGNCKDAAELTGAEQKQWRTQAITWLHADLNDLEHGASNNIEAQHAMGFALRNWRNDPDLIVVRDPGWLLRLDSEERNQWSALWRQVDSHLGASGEVTR